EVESCTDWDSDLPIDMQRITKEDERYWDLYRNTPKALVAYGAVASRWGNAYGDATAVRIGSPAPSTEALRPDMFGVQLIHPREQGLLAARSGVVDFSSLFLSLGFFIIVAAVMLMLAPLSEMLYRRRGELRLLAALGYPRRRLAQLLWREAMPTAVASSAGGVAAGLLYAGLSTQLLSTLWQGATHTSAIALSFSAGAALAGLAFGICLSYAALNFSVRKFCRRELGSAPTRRRRTHRHRPLPLRAAAATALTLAAIAANLLTVRSTALSVCTGAACIGVAALWGSYLIRRKSAAGALCPRKLTCATLAANQKNARLSFLTLALGVFVVFSVGLNRPGFSDEAQLQGETGGYALWCESTVPIYHSLATRAGRAKLALADLPADVETLQLLRRAADDASCLNLNRVNTPTALGVDMQALAGSRFEVEQSLEPLGRADFFRAMQQRRGEAIPAVVDATTLAWGLGLRLGDTLRYDLGGGRTAAVLLMGTLKSSVFQGSILLDRRLFAEIWPEVTGSEVLLVKASEAQRGQVAQLLATALSDYGVRLSSTADRLRAFNSVADTYLTIFMTLGGLSLLLGVAGLAVAVRKNLLMRGGELALYRAVGYPRRRALQMLRRESLTPPLCAIAVGIAGALVGMGGNFFSVGLGLWGGALLLAAALVGFLLLFVKKSLKNRVN
ncbi:MAG: FtsX-like permease family protein, partial [Prevotellaceae bacterium]|nr:FtsX-like permease family protein [Prevotellaceae bacterium]